MLNFIPSFDFSNIGNGFSMLDVKPSLRKVTGSKVYNNGSWVYVDNYYLDFDLGGKTAEFALMLSVLEPETTHAVNTNSASLYFINFSQDDSSWTDGGTTISPSQRVDLQKTSNSQLDLSILASKINMINNGILQYPIGHLYKDTVLSSVYYFAAIFVS